MEVLVVDDEAVILNGLLNIVRKSDYKAVGALDGFQALSMLAEHPVDLMITDINMPEMDGLELIRRASKLNPHLRFIILTGYDEFEYARQAVKLQVADYLLKPINKQELLELLAKMKRELADDRSREHLPFAGRLRDVVCDNDPEAAAAISEADKELYFPLPYLCVAAIGGYKGSFAEAERMLADLHAYCNDAFARAYCFELRAVRQYVVVISHPERLEARHLEQLHGYLERLEWQPDKGWRIGASMSGHSFDVRKLYTEAAEALLYNKMIAGQSCSFYSQIRVEGGEHEGLAPLLKEMMLYLERGSEHEASYCIVTIFDRLRREQVSVLSSLKSLYAEFVVRISAFALDRGLDPDGLFDAGNGQAKELSWFGNLAEMEQYWLRVLEQAISCVKELDDNPSRSSTMTKLLNYIHRHYDRDLSLDTIAEHASLHPNYVSSLFRKEIGETMLAYLNGYRIRIAKELLHIHPHKTVNEIGLTVGFLTARHFYKVFKEHTDMTPGQYREQLQKE